MAEQKAPEVRKFICRQKRHWIPPSGPGRARRRWTIGMIYEGVDVPPEDYFDEIDVAAEKAIADEKELQKFMQPQTLLEEQLLAMETKKQVVGFITQRWPDAVEELGIKESMGRFDLNRAAFELLRKE